MKLNNHYIVALGLFLLSWVVYTAATSQYTPFYSYHHELYQAQAFLQGRFDVVDLPDYYHDVTVKDGKTYLPFGPTPALFLSPFVAVFGTKVNPQYVGALIGALNVALVYLLLKKTFKNLTTYYLLLTTIFFAFGTVHFYSVFIGSTWFLAQIIGVFLTLLAINIALASRHTIYDIRHTILIGIILGFATLARAPLILATPYFIRGMYRNLKDFKEINSQPTTSNFQLLISKFQPLTSHLSLLFLGLAIPFAFQLWFNFARFGSILQDGHELVYHNYLNMPVPVTIAQYYFPGFPLFNFLDIRNIPLHICTAFLLLPKFMSTFPYMEFLPFGTSILFTSPLLLLLPWADWKNKAVQASGLTALLIMTGVFLHFTQGWVQFSYRFLLDFLPFLIIPLSSAIGRCSTKLVTALLTISVLMNVLGVIYGAR